MIMYIERTSPMSTCTINPLAHIYIQYTIYYTYIQFNISKKPLQNDGECPSSHLSKIYVKRTSLLLHNLSILHNISSYTSASCRNNLQHDMKRSKVTGFKYPPSSLTSNTRDYLNVLLHSWNFRMSCVHVNGRIANHELVALLHRGRGQIGPQESTTFRILSNAVQVKVPRILDCKSHKLASRLSFQQSSGQKLDD